MMDTTAIAALVTAAVIPMGAACWKAIDGLLERKRQRLKDLADERAAVRVEQAKERDLERQGRATERKEDREDSRRRDEVLTKLVTSVERAVDALQALQRQQLDHHREVLAEIRGLDCAKHEEAE